MTPDFFFTHTLTVQRPTWENDRSGAPRVVSWASVAGLVNVPCSAQPADARTIMFWAQRNVTVTHELYCGSVLAIQEGDRLQVTHPEAGASELLSVTGWFDECFQGRLFVVGATRVET